MALETVTVNLAALKRMREAAALWREPTSRTTFLWAARYRSFVQLRFDRFSKGGGSWPPLKESTIRRRRKGKGEGLRAAILRDTGILFAALDPVFRGQPGAIEEHVPFGVRVGFGGSDTHKGTNIAVSQIAYFHQVGSGHLPQREMIVEPDSRTVAGMAKDLERQVMDSHK